jgi:hypothetical protein
MTITKGMGPWKRGITEDEASLKGTQVVGCIFVKAQ